ncbi:hypothetical protein K9M47_02905 [Candidatus Gracilibacteria bacterium]|nr:hypothetical protein [Candidatus Gracilibacteria bacterium]
MKDKNNIIIGVVLVVLVVVIYFWGMKDNTVQTEGFVDVVVSTTTDEVANINPVVLKNEIKVVPKKETTVTPATPVAQTDNYIKLGQRSLLNDIYVTPTKVTYDNRCPVDVQCIQAGTTEVGVLFERGSLSQNIIIALGKSIVFDGKTITLTDVKPNKVSTKSLYDTDYRFLVSVEN